MADIENETDKTWDQGLEREEKNSNRIGLKTKKHIEIDQKTNNSTLS